MSAGGPAGNVIGAIMAKDLRSFARDRLWLVLTPVSVVTVAAAFWLAPSEIDDIVRVGIHPPAAVALLASLGEQAESNEGVLRVPFADEERMVAAIEGTLEDASEQEQEILLGLSFPVDFDQQILLGRETSVTLYVNPGIPPSLKNALAGEIREVGYGLQAVLTGKDPVATFPVELPPDREMILGEDMAGRQVPMRDKMRPMLALMILMLGSVAIAGLVACEIENRTVTAILVTPARIADLLAAKALTGTLLGVSQALVFFLLTASFGAHWWMLLLVLLLAALMMAALGLIAGAAGRDFMSTMFLTVALMVPLAVPTFAVLFPGSTSPLVAAMPSYGLVDAMMGLVGYGRSPAEVLQPTLLGLGWTVLLFAIALGLLKRRVESL